VQTATSETAFLKLCSRYSLQ